MSQPPSRRTDALVIVTLGLSLLGYALFALFVARWAISGVVALLVALLLVTRHARARFSAYVFFSAMGIRTAVGGHWGTLLFALAAIALLQTPAALRLWPRLGAPARMARP